MTIYRAWFRLVTPRQYLVSKYEMRADLVRRQNYWVLIDRDFDTVVLTTESRTVAAHWQRWVNACKHARPYDILWHDFKSVEKK